MMNIAKKLLSILMALTMMSSMLVVSIYADDTYDTVSGSATTVFGNLSFVRSAGNDKKDDANAYDGTYSSCNWGGSIRTLSKTFYVEREGTYALSFNAVTDLTLDGASPMKFSIDGEEYVTMDRSNSNVTALKNPWTSVDGWTVKNVAYNGEFVFEEGLHTLEIEIPKRSSGDVVIYVFDCATITPTNNILTIAGDSPTTIGNSAFQWNETNDKKNNASAYDGTYSSSNWGSAVRTATVSFYVETEQRYSFDINGVFDLTLSGASPVKFSIDEGQMITLTSSNATVSNLTTPWQTNVDGWTVKNIAYHGDFMLEEGLHTLTFEIPKRSSNDVVIYVFDCVTITPPAPNQIITDENNVLEFERYYPSKAVVSDGASGGEVVDFLQYSATERCIEMIFDVETAGEYLLVMDASLEQGVSSFQDNLSPAFISVNGGEEIEISHNQQGNFTITADATYESPNGWSPSRITLARKFDLVEGENSITVRVAARRGGDMVVGTFDCIKLVRNKVIESITQDMGNGLITRGETIPVRMKNQNNETVNPEDFSQITYTFTDDNIAEVQNGVLLAKNYGKTTLTITAVSNGIALEAEYDICVVSEKGIWIDSVEKTESGVKINVSAMQSYSGGDQLLVGVYGQREGRVTSLKTIATAATLAMEAMDDREVEISVSDVEENDVIRVFLIDADNSMRAIYTKYTLGGVDE